MRFLTLLIGKLLLAGLRLVGREGTALPGLVAEKLKPGLMAEMLGTLPDGVIVVTGTNGKTTTTKMISGLLESQGKRVISNQSGSNMSRGIFSVLLRHGTLGGKLDFDMGVFELDEAYSRLFAEQVPPKLVVALNVMRDQLDRYGEIDTTAQHIGDALSYAGGAILNADDPPVAALSSSLRPAATLVYFGVSDALRKLLPSDEELHEQDAPAPRPTPPKDIVLSHVRNERDDQTIEFLVGDEQHRAEFPLEGVHNAVNAVAAIATVKAALPSVPTEQLAVSLGEIRPAFGRGELIAVRGRNLHVALVKNPGSFNQNLRALVGPSTKVVVLLVNDRYADGRDTSWFWDVDVSQLEQYGPTIIVGGIRAHDMALRLQYEDIAVAAIEPDIAKALDVGLASGRREDDVLVFPTYTAMLEVRNVLKREVQVEEMW